jgi:hypothetical protein
MEADVDLALFVDAAAAPAEPAVPIASAAASATTAAGAGTRRRVNVGMADNSDFLPQYRKTSRRESRKVLVTPVPSACIVPCTPTAR